MTRPLINWHTRTTSDRTLGQRSADVLRNGMGSWPFVFAFLAFMSVWAAVQSTEIRWDPYPFILLNLFLSMLAGLQGAILLIAAKRQDAISASLAQHDYETNVAAAREIEQLLDINRRQLELLEHLVAERDGRDRRDERTDGDGGPTA
ncbi:uncharacterized protein DUF1003 [Microcella putealis]|uniref:Uncharacterized protein DUF1003 n=1 Tax=Microcella putealis TaxID=337005 RepID=A0A4Q7LNY2_9MICO|nr:DUF1003 domain-containing protein [Microcella putealis]RZS56406.1 uncharacterized protein DUF1003 [Microcella putealis]TQM27108.1 uncharacterized protein DUF1003 [Microcella putealis]